MIKPANFLATARHDLPLAILARWASIFFSLSVLTFLISLSAAQALLAVAGVCYAVHLLRDRPEVHFPPVKLPLTLFCLGTILSVFYSANPTVGWFAVRKLVLFVILLLGTNLIVTSRHLGRLYRGLFLEAAVAGIVAAAQFIMQYRALRILQPDRVYTSITSDRITGFMGHWMNFGGQQMLVFATLVAFLLLGLRIEAGGAEARGPGLGARQERALRRSGALLWWGVLSVIVFSIVLNFTRGVWLGCLVATIYLVGRWKPRWLAALPVLLVVGYFAAPSLVRRRVEVLRHPTRDPALSIRFEMWGAAARMIRAHPLVGVGPNAIEQVYPLYLPPGKTPERGYHSHMHNNFFQFGAERGLPVLAAWVWLMLALGWQFWRIGHRLAIRRWVADAALAGWLALMVEGCFEFNFGTSPVLMLFLFVATTPFVAEKSEPQPGRQLTAESRDSN